jgi:adenine deaminase
MRVLRERVEAPKTAAKLAAAKVRFAFQSGGLANSSEFIANAGKTIENGLLLNDALRALTIWPAEILGAGDRLGTLEPGKIANLTVVRGDLFDRNSRVTHVFIDGRPVDLRPAPRPAASGSPQAETSASGTVAGTWSINIVFGTQTIPGTLTLTQSGTTVSGSLLTDQAKAEFSNAPVSESGFQTTTTAVVQGQSLQVQITASVKGDEISGNISSTLGPATFTGKRRP